MLLVGLLALVGRAGPELLSNWCYIFRMTSDSQLLEHIQPVASAILEVDAKALAQVSARREAYAALDPQPAAAAMAWERRAIVATVMHKEIAPSFGWTLVKDNFESGAYEWIVGGTTIVRLSKTTKESRLEDAKAALQRQGIQGTLFTMAAHSTVTRDEILIRLMGNALRAASVDAVALRPNGEHGTTIALRTMAEMQVEQLRSAVPPARTRITVPDTRRISESG